jgi:hypothetical protein
LAFYDKVDEYKANDLPIPPEYLGKNVFRYELRFLKHLLNQFNLPVLKAETLYDEKFYERLIVYWYNEYSKIRKQRNMNPVNFSKTKSVIGLKSQALLYFINSFGGETEFLKYIEMAQKRKEINKTEAYKLRVSVKEACKSEILTCESNVITELDEKISSIVYPYMNATNVQIEY